MARSDELLISRSSTFLSRLAFAASSFICSSAVWPSAPLVGLSGVGDGRPEKDVTRGEGMEVTLSHNDILLNWRLSVGNGLGVMIDGSLTDFLSSVMESIEDRLALL